MDEYLAARFLVTISIVCDVLDFAPRDENLFHAGNPVEECRLANSTNRGLPGCERLKSANTIQPVPAATSTQRAKTILAGGSSSSANTMRPNRHRHQCEWDTVHHRGTGPILQRLMNVRDGLHDVSILRSHGRSPQSDTKSDRAFPIDRYCRRDYTPKFALPIAPGRCGEHPDRLCVPGARQSVLPYWPETKVVGRREASRPLPPSLQNWSALVRSPASASRLPSGASPKRFSISFRIDDVS